MENSYGNVSNVESKYLARYCIIYNSILQGFKVKGYPLIETNAPTLVIQAAQNLSEFLLTKDISKYVVGYKM